MTLKYLYADRKQSFIIKSWCKSRFVVKYSVTLLQNIVITPSENVYTKLDMNFKSCCAAMMVMAMLASCSTHKKVPLVEDAEYIPAEILAQPVPPADPIIQAGDLLNIDVTATNYQAVAAFNKGRYVNSDGTIDQSRGRVGSGGNNETSTDYYLVDKDGNINFPIIGSIHVGGLTKTQVQAEIENAIYPKYLKEKPVVDIRFMNFRITVLGAVGSPGIKVSQNERLNIFEAIALAGDLNIKADRENLILIRTNPDGTREVHKLNVHDKNMLFSPYYNLQQNDLLLVNWNRSGAQNSWAMSQGFSTTIAVVGGLSAVLGFTLSIINLSK